MFYTAVWCHSSENDFKNSVPLRELGRSIRRFNSSIRFNIVILEGIHLLSKDYLQELESYGFDVIDHCDEFVKIIKEYPAISEHYNAYERNCLLRWIAFYRLVTRHGIRQFWHLDSDVVLHCSLDELASETTGKTFVLQGCPVFVSISNLSWFSVYGSELRKLDANITGYSANAAATKELNRGNDLELCNESLYRNPIGSDQDLIEYLVSARKIYQETASVIYISRFYYIQNVLSLKKWHSSQAYPNSRFDYSEDNRISIGDKIVPFIHFQNTFTKYAHNYILLRRMGIKGMVLKQIMRFKIENDKFQTSFLFKLAGKLSRVFHQSSSREEIIQRLIEPKKSVNIVSILNFINRTVDESAI